MPSTVVLFHAQYNHGMADRIACSCVTCPKCGTWVVVRQPSEAGLGVKNSERMEQRKPNPRARHQTSVFNGERGWMSRKISAPPVQGEKCSLTSPFIEQAFTPLIKSNERRARFFSPTIRQSRS